MASSLSEWDEKHGQAAGDAVEAPAGILSELLPLLPGESALELACGTGRNALFLAEHGRHVTAVDWSPVALDTLENRAHSRQVPVRRIQRLEEGKEGKRPARPGIDLLLSDLEGLRLPDNHFQLIVCIRYLQRSLFPEICRALRPGGMILFETYTRAQLDFSGGPRNPAHLLDCGELRKAFPELSVVFYRELRAGQGIASLAARKPRGHNQNGDSKLLARQ